jgi:ribosome-associated toxin RatA of RatAB toxin-antitoxin module
MAHINRSALVLHTQEQMFNIVNDVRAYPEFLPWCSSSQIIHEDVGQLEATLHLSKAGLKYSFTTRNQLHPYDRMEIQLVEGPFSKLVGVWTFEALSDEACKVSLDLQFEFANKLAGMAMAKVFNQVAATLVDAFVQRADALHG